MKLRFPVRVVRTRELDELREQADRTLAATVHCAAALFALQTVHGDRAQTLRHLDLVVDDLQVHILRRARAAQLLQEIDPTGLPEAAAAQILTAREALIRGGEEVTA
ncbi:hypothetical protein [Streptomyces acidiscabies]|uniref:Uncharacterized protein n=1 Tax=Streptomyces acidiscabies TaxID=42234 RepID=A0AAP6BKI9_9ACTN|nr:hypothetical protein [Streptomyces acidiscabies]MBZ3918118.1 hypothetical protein [Streptomyces acidiscabies]MDX2966433.1 hypothetical protein [Streptomyces acidiscabies]MDX3796379.1 hypothetical protein [Streptomyces acidiscabies]